MSGGKAKKLRRNLIHMLGEIGFKRMYGTPSAWRAAKAHYAHDLKTRGRGFLWTHI